VVSALESVINVCNQEKIALIVADPSTVDKGALASYGIGSIYYLQDIGFS